MGDGGKALIEAINWIDKESKDSKSRFYNKVNMQKIAAMGMSCGGIMSYGASGDPHVTTVGIWNSGLFSAEDRKKHFDMMHGTAIIITGGESDIAYANGKADFENMPAKIPVFYGVYPSVGHRRHLQPGQRRTVRQGGRALAEVAAGWRHQRHRQGLLHRQHLRSLQGPNWKVQSRSLK